MIVVAVVSSRFPESSPGLQMLERVYQRQNRNRRHPCVESKTDMFRVLQYDINKAAGEVENRRPLLLTRHNVVPGMVLIYCHGNLLFCDHIFNGYGCAEDDFRHQLRQCHTRALKSFSLPRDFRFRYEDKDCKEKTGNAGPLLARRRTPTKNDTCPPRVATNSTLKNIMLLRNNSRFTAQRRSKFTVLNEDQNVDTVPPTTTAALAKPSSEYTRLNEDQNVDTVPPTTTAALAKPSSEYTRLNEDQNVDTVPPTTDSTKHSSSPSGITICPVVETVTSDHVSTQTDSKLAESRSSVEASVQAGSATNESSGLEEPQITFDEVPLFRNRFSENHNSQCPPSVNWNIICGTYKESWCSHTIKKNRYTLSCMLLYMIMTTFLTRVFHLDSEFSCLSTCSLYDDILDFNAISLLVSGISLAIQLTLDTYGVHSRSALLFNIVMSTIQMMLYFVTFVRIYHCRGSLFDYLFPALTFVMCIGYACLGIVTLPKILGCSNVY
ncbi:unnamed protein product [Acanthosepion pharaonis]|uniref:Uncharacterized protein n=1 Tax=Acanthosepion pharaonis TaxID=158019 RepID=A0A812C1W1_ACAPH|nr:unnamed protein product [Sepia pharaonis]